jgi:fatty-acyl-CoA synthase
MVTIPGSLAVNARRCPDRLAVVFGERCYSYAEFDGTVNQAAHALAAAGLRKGDRMLIMSGNTDRFIIALYAALRLGALVVPVNPASAAPELQHILDDSGASLLVFGGGTQTVVQAADHVLAGALAGPPIALDPVEGYRNLRDLRAPMTRPPARRIRQLSGTGSRLSTPPDTETTTPQAPCDHRRMQVRRISRVKGCQA